MIGGGIEVKTSIYMIMNNRGLEELQNGTRFKLVVEECKPLGKRPLQKDFALNYGYVPKEQYFKESRATVKTLHVSSDRKEVEYVREKLMRTLKEKTELLKERQVLKKIDIGDVSHLIEEIDRKLRQDYFEVKIEDIVRQYREENAI